MGRPSDAAVARERTQTILAGLGASASALEL
jgi:hypothetical protein